MNNSWKKITFVVLLICAFFIAPACATGTGAIDDPYLITNSTELQSIQNDLSAYYQLVNDIDLTGVTWTPIGNISTPFFGHVDGDGHTISNLVYSNINVDNVGLFSIAGSGASFVDVTLDSCSITGNSYVAGLIGQVIMSVGAHDDCVITNVDVTNCDIYANTSYAGTLVARTYTNAYTKISYCDVSCGNVTTGSTNCGGLMGNGADSASVLEMNDCTVDAMVIITGSSSCGGLMGYGAGSASVLEMNDCTVMNSVITTGSNACGGLMGNGAFSASDCTVTACTVTNCVITTGSADCGGLMGNGATSASVANVTDCTVTECTVYGTTGTASGLVAFGDATSNLTINNCEVDYTTILAGSGSTAGLLVTAAGNTTITNCDISNSNIKATVNFAPAGAYDPATCTASGITNNATNYLEAKTFTVTRTTETMSCAFTVEKLGGAVTVGGDGHVTSGHLWVFGDGDFSADLATTTSHTYAIGGTETSSITLTNKFVPAGSVLTKIFTLDTTKLLSNISILPTTLIGDETLTFNASSDTAATLDWQISIDGVWTTIATATSLGNNAVVTATYVVPNTLPDNTYLFRLDANNIAGHTYSPSTLVTINHYPLATITSPTTGDKTIEHTEYTFTADYLFTPTAYLWSFGDGATATTASATHTYTASGDYNITLTVTNVYGSSTTSLQQTTEATYYSYTLNEASETMTGAMGLVALIPLVLAGILVFTIIKGGANLTPQIVALLVTIGAVVVVIYIIIILGGFVDKSSLEIMEIVANFNK